MSGQFERLPVTDADPHRNRRKVARSPAEVTASVRSSQGDEAVVRIADVSTHGCSVRGDLPWLRNGAFVAIGLGDGPALSAIVRWMRDGSAGMEFLRPVPSDRTEWQMLINSPLEA